MIPVTFLGGYNKEIQEKLFPHFLGSLSEFFHHLGKHYYRKKVILDKEVLFELNTDVIRLGGNLIHTFREAQDFLVDHGYVLCYLDYAGYDKNSPLAREATVVFIRYITDTNQRARDVISSLKVQKLDPDSLKDVNDYSSFM